MDWVKDVARYWKLLPLAARRYIVFHSISTPILFVWILVPYLMLSTGISVEEAGFILSAASLCAAVINVVVGRVLEAVEPVVFIALISFIEGFAYLVYMCGFLAGLAVVVLVAAIIERIARGFYPVFAVYEYDVYPEEIRDKAFALHNIFPFLAQVASYPVIGWVLGVVLSDLRSRIISLAGFSIASIATGFLAFAWLPRLGRKRVEIERIGLKFIPREFAVMLLSVVMLGVSVELAQPLIVANLFMGIARNPLLGLALYETFAAVPITLLSPIVLRMDRRHGVKALALGMAMLAVADAILGLSTGVYVALLAAALSSAGYALMDPFYMDTLFSTIPSDKRGVLLGGIASIRRLVSIAMPAAAGLLASASARIPFFVAALFTLGSMVTALRVATSREGVEGESYPTKRV